MFWRPKSVTLTILHTIYSKSFSIPPKQKQAVPGVRRLWRQFWDVVHDQVADAVVIP